MAVAPDSRMLVGSGMSRRFTISRKRKHKACDGPSVCNVLASSRCCCFSSTYISIYKKDTEVHPGTKLPCFVKECKKRGVHGAHVKAAGTCENKVILILPSCRAHNKPRSDECNEVKEKYKGEGKAVRLYCCCFTKAKDDFQCECRAGKLTCRCNPEATPEKLCTCEPGSPKKRRRVCEEPSL